MAYIFEEPFHVTNLRARSSANIKLNFLESRIVFSGGNPFNNKLHSNPSLLIVPYRVELANGDVIGMRDFSGKFQIWFYGCHVKKYVC